LIILRVSTHLDNAPRECLAVAGHKIANDFTIQAGNYERKVSSQEQEGSMAKK
jgi:hypothetical protein